MDNPEQRLEALERRVAELAAALAEVRQTLALVGDVQRFSQLRELLAAGQLDAADRETARLLADLLRGPEGEISPEALQHCPAPALQIIDRLWRGASDDRLGFAIQQQLYGELGGSRATLIAQDEALFHRFCSSVGWPLLEGLGFALPADLQVPVPAAVAEDGRIRAGHLPLRCWASDYGLKAANLWMARLIEVFGS